MNNRERTIAILNYEKYDRLPIVHFGYWQETLNKWCDEGHLKGKEIVDFSDGSENEKVVSNKLGFDYNWYTTFQQKSGLGSLYPVFEPKIVEELSNDMRKVLNCDGVIILVKDGVTSISAEVDHLLKDRESWEKLYLPKLKFSQDRVDSIAAEEVRKANNDQPLGVFCGSLFGQIRNWMGVEGISYLYADDEELFDDIINTVGDLCYHITKTILNTGVKFDFAHFWEDICFKNGPLVNPSVFQEKVGPHYKKITDLLKQYGINIISLDCDGVIDSLIPAWLENGVNTMFPIEVGTWEASILPWRKKYGSQIRGVGGMNKNVFAQDYAAVDKEIERLKVLIELGGYIPCPDHRIPPTAKWENVQYYCDRMRKIFG